MKQATTSPSKRLSSPCLTTRWPTMNFKRIRSSLMSLPPSPAASSSPRGVLPSHCVILDPFEDARAIDHGAVRAGYPQDLVMVAVEVAGMKESGFPAIE